MIFRKLLIMGQLAEGFLESLVEPSKARQSEFSELASPARGRCHLSRWRRFRLAHAGHVKMGHSVRGLSQMKSFVLLSVFSALAAFAQAPQSSEQLASDAVIAVIGDKNLTFGELQGFVSSLPPEAQKNALSNKPELLREYALMKYLSDQAEKQKLDQKSPYKEALASHRMQLLSQAQVNEHYQNISITPEDQQKYYDEHKDRFAQIKLKLLYVSFAANPSAAPAGKKYRSEAEAKAKIEDLAKQIRDGADFVKLVKENSDDATSKAQDGDFPPIRRTDNQLPQDVMDLVFRLKKGQVSDPVRRPNGYYLFRAEDITTPPIDTARDEVVGQLRDLRMKEWLDATTKNIPLKIQNQSFGGPPAPPAAAPKGQ
jgi:peptidyl-prolyl cis-trans isomerase C